jgi:hypothetical protein
MRFVFEEKEPVFLFAVFPRFDADGTGVDFITHLKIGQLALFEQEFHHDGGGVHKRNRAFFAVNRFMQGDVAVVRALDVLRVNAHLIYMRQEGGMAAVVGPVGVQQPQLGHGGVAPRVTEENPAAGKVVGIHGQPHLLDKGFQTAEFAETVDGLHIGGGTAFVGQRQGDLAAAFAALNRVENGGPQFIAVPPAQLAYKDIHLRPSDTGF